MKSKIPMTISAYDVISDQLPYPKTLLNLVKRTFGLKSHMMLLPKVHLFSTDFRVCRSTSVFLTSLPLYKLPNQCCSSAVSVYFLRHLHDNIVDQQQDSRPTILYFMSGSARGMCSGAVILSDNKSVRKVVDSMRSRSMH